MPTALSRRLSQTAPAMRGASLGGPPICARLHQRVAPLHLTLGGRLSAVEERIAMRNLAPVLLQLLQLPLLQLSLLLMPCGVLCANLLPQGGQQTAGTPLGASRPRPGADQGRCRGPLAGQSPASPGISRTRWWPSPPSPASLLCLQSNEGEAAGVGSQTSGGTGVGSQTRGGTGGAERAVQRAQRGDARASLRLHSVDLQVTCK